MLVKSIEAEGYTATTYNLTVANAHTFFVGEERIWVHNDDGCGGGGNGEQSTDIPENFGQGIDPEFLKDHNTNPTFDRRKGIQGGHNEGVFKAELESRGGRIVGEQSNPEQPGIKTYEYELPKRGPDGQIIPGEFRRDGNWRKTVYDPDILSDDAIADMISRAARSAEFRGGNRRAIVEIDGYQFMVYRDLETGEKTNSHLITG